MRAQLPNDLGLSPRVRGNPGHPAHSLCYSRSIPACAGEPQPWALSTRSRTVYPRVCGGTLPGGRPQRQRYRSIPACAGEPVQSSGGHPKHQVYPRVCGGTAPATVRADEWKGLSPRVRGNPCPYHQMTDRAWSIPACAGEPGHLDGLFPSSRVYPRVCGGTPSSSRMSRMQSGLSPRVRGNPNAKLS